MAPKGRPRLTPDEYEARLKAYCSKYSVKPTSEGIPPFPSGRRETAQHREWLGVYKAKSRLERNLAVDSAAAVTTHDGARCPLCNGSLKAAAPEVLERVRRYVPPKGSR